MPPSTSRKALASVDRLDGRGWSARRYRLLLREITKELGGDSVVTAAQRQLAQRGAALCVAAELMEADLAQHKPMDTDAFVRICNAQNRVFATLGLKGFAPEANADMDLETYLAMRASEGNPEAAA